MKLNFYKKYFNPIKLSLIFVAGMVAGIALQKQPVANDIQIVTNNDNIESVEEAMMLIKNKYYSEISMDELSDKTIKSVVKNLDPYSWYFDSAHVGKMTMYNENYYIGFGFEMGHEENPLVVSKIYKGSPFDKNGIKKGFVISRLDDMNLLSGEIEIDSVFRYLKKNNEATQFEFKTLKGDKILYTIHRDTIRTQNIGNSVDLGEGNHYIKIDKFGKGVYKDFMERLDSAVLGKNSIEGLIIDLRSNPGGNLKSTLKILDQLVNERVNMLTVVNKNGKDNIHESSGNNFFQIDDIVVLINSKSASASEILAGCLQDLNRATVIGEPSFGKGLIQEIYELSNGGKLKLSVGEYKLPSGRKIGNTDSTDVSQGKIKPDIYIKGRSEYAWISYLNRIDSSILKSESAFLNNIDLDDIEDDNLKTSIKQLLTHLIFGNEFEEIELMRYDPYIIKAIEILDKSKNAHTLNN